MKVSIDNLLKAAHGCSEVREESQGIFFDRLGKSLNNFYRKANVASEEGFAALARSPAGVRIRFRSDSPWVRAEFRYGQYSRPLFGADVFVDGELTGTYGPVGSCATEWSGRVFQASVEQLRQFDIWLPYGAETWLLSLEVADHALFEPIPPSGVKWLAIGDSITQGMDAARPSSTYAAIIARNLGLALHDTAVGGAALTSEAVESGALTVWPSDSSLISVALGVGNWTRCTPIDQFERNALALLRRLLQGRSEVRLLLITPLPTVSDVVNENGIAMDEYRSALWRVGRLFPAVRVVEGDSLIQADQKYFADHIHPNDCGMACLAKSLLPHFSAEGISRSPECKER